MYMEFHISILHYNTTIKNIFFDLFDFPRILNGTFFLTIIPALPFYLESVNRKRLVALIPFFVYHPVT